MSVEANLEELIEHKRELLKHLNEEISHKVANRNVLSNQIQELEALFPSDPEPALGPDLEDEEFRIGGPEGAVVRTKGRPIMDRPQA